MKFGKVQNWYHPAGILLCFLPSYNPVPMPCHPVIIKRQKQSHRARRIHLDLDSTVKSLALLLSAGLSLGTHNTATPVSLGLLVLLSVTLLDGLDHLGKLSLVLGADLSQSEDSSGLLVDDRAESGLTLDDGVWDTHLSAESWEEDNQLNWINIVGDENQ